MVLVKDMTCCDESSDCEVILNLSTVSMPDTCPCGVKQCSKSSKSHLFSL